MLTPQKVLATLMVLVAGSASAQTFYQPVTYQYQYHGQFVYYAGHNPHMFEYVAADIDRTTYNNAVTRPMHVMYRHHIYSDSQPYQNLADDSVTCYRGMSTADAENEANAQVPLYFSMRDVNRTGVIHEDGSRTVPADMVIGTSHQTVLSPGADPATPRGTILIIPKKLLQPPAQQSGPTVASAK